MDERRTDLRAIFSGPNPDYRWISSTELGAVPVRSADLPDRHSPLQLGPEAPPGSELGRVRFFLGEADVGERPVL